MNLPQRKPVRLKNYNYSAPGGYFLTICTAKHEKLLCSIVGDGALDVPKTKLTAAGKIVEKYIISANNIKKATVQKFVIMPNHIHLLVSVCDTGGTSRAPSPTTSVIPHFVSTLKRFVNREIGKNIFQRSYYDHIIRGERDYQKIWLYMENNPAKWKEDCFYSE